MLIFAYNNDQRVYVVARGWLLENANIVERVRIRNNILEVHLSSQEKPSMYCIKFIHKNANFFFKKLNYPTQIDIGKNQI